MSQCPRCGTAGVRDGQRFCAQCGTDLTVGDRSEQVPPPAPDTVAPVAPLPAPPPPYAQQAYAQPVVPAPQPAGYAGGSGGRRTPLVLLTIAALLAALLGAGGVVLLLEGGDGSGSGTTTEDRRDDGDTTPETAATPTTGPTESGTTEQQQTFRCWDGAAVASLDSCSRPSGVEGMAWVFPSSTGSTCSAEAGVQRVTEADCTPTVAGAAVRMHYSEWPSRDALESYYGGLTVGTIDPPGGRDDLTARQVVSRDSDVGYKVAIYYTSAAGLWSVTVYAADEAQYLAALDELEIRPFGQLQGRRG